MCEYVSLFECKFEIKKKSFLKLHKSDIKLCKIVDFFSEKHTF